MNMDKQRGLGMIPMLLIIIAAGFVVLTAVKLFPYYSDDYTVKNVLVGIEEEPNLSDYSTSRIKTLLDKRLSVNAIRHLSSKDFVIDANGDDVYISVEYEIREHLFYNVDVVLVFFHEIEIN